MSNIRDLTLSASKALLVAVKKAPGLDTDPVFVSLTHALASALASVETVFSSTQGRLHADTSYVAGQKSFIIELEFVTALNPYEAYASIPGLPSLVSQCEKAFKAGLSKSPSNFRKFQTSALFSPNRPYGALTWSIQSTSRVYGSLAFRSAKTSQNPKGFFSVFLELDVELE